jgi:hypothetical protein
MPNRKDIKKISELEENFSSDQLKISTIFQTLKSLKLSVNFSEFNFLKKQGYAFNVVLLVLIWLTVHDKKTVNSSLSELSANGIKAEKDVYYRLKNSTKICWRRILWYVVNKFLQQTQKNTEIAYILLAFRFRYDNYESMGALFRAIDDEILQKTIDIRLWELFVKLIQTVCQMIEKDFDEVMDLIMRKPEMAQWVENIIENHYKQAS